MTAALSIGSAGQIGPNAVVQLANAMRAESGAKAAERLFRRAGHADLLSNPPTAMMDECIPAKLFAQLWQDEPGQAAAIAAEAGRRTADYVISNRIPQTAKLAMGLMPRRLAAYMLLSAICRNAWTFAGSGACAVSMSPQPLISITDNPLRMPECVWHTAVLKQMFRRLVSVCADVQHSTTHSDGTCINHFKISLSRHQTR